MNTEYYLISPDGTKVKLNIDQMTYATTNPSSVMKFTMDASVQKVEKPYQGKFGGYITSGTYITKVIVNKPAVIVLWSDDTKTVAKCDNADYFDVEKGLLLCALKRVTTNEWVAKLLADWTKNEENGNYTVTLNEVRRKHRTGK